MKIGPCIRHGPILLGSIMIDEKEVDSLLLRASQFETRLVGFREQLAQSESDLEKSIKEIQLINGSTSLIQYLTEKVSAGNEVKAAQLVTCALRETFQDLELTMQTEHSTSRGNPSVEILLKEEISGVVDDPIEGFGGGIS